MRGLKSSKLHFLPEVKTSFSTTLLCCDKLFYYR